MTGADQVVQGVITRLRLFRGEWKFDVEAGTDWYGTVFVDTPDIRLIEFEFKRVINSTPGVDEITRFSPPSYDPGTRELSLSFEVLSVFGPSGSIEVTL